MELRVIRTGERTPGQPTSGMIRDQAFAREGVWVGSVRTQPGMVSGWHHHGEHETYLYLLRGRARFETAQVQIDAGPGDFIVVPPRLVHREMNPSQEESELIAFRLGRGEVVVNVEAP